MTTQLITQLNGIIRIDQLYVKVMSWWMNLVNDGATLCIPWDLVEIGMITAEISTTDKIDIILPLGTSKNSRSSRRPAVSILVVQWDEDQQLVKIRGRTILSANRRHYNIQISASDMVSVPQFMPNENEYIGYISKHIIPHTNVDQTTLIPIATALVRLKHELEQTDMDIKGVTPVEQLSTHQLNTCVRQLSPTWEAWCRDSFVRTIVSQIMAFPHMQRTLLNAYRLVSVAFFECLHPSPTALVTQIWSVGQTFPINYPGIGIVDDILVRVLPAPLNPTNKTPRIATVTGYVSLRSGTVNLGNYSKLIDGIIDSAKHRNGNLYGFDACSVLFVFSNATPAIVRSAYSCMTCEQTATQCVHTTPTIIAGQAILTAADVTVVVWSMFVNSINKMLARAVKTLPQGVNIGNRFECTCGVLVGDTSLCIRCLSNNATVDNMDSTTAMITPLPSKWRPTNGRDMGINVDAIYAQFIEMFGIIGELTFGRPAVIMRATLIKCVNDITATYQNNPTMNLEPPVDDYNMIKTVSTPVTNLTAYMQRRTELLTNIPGYPMLVSTGWDVFSVIRPYTPPCLSILIDAYAIRHPKFLERRLILGFLAGITGLMADRTGFAATWMRFFSHHTNEGVRTQFFQSDTETGVRKFLGSKYGNVMIDDTRKCVAANRPGCKFAHKNGMCPFAECKTGEDTIPLPITTQLCDIEDVRQSLGNSSAAARKLQPAQIKTVCSQAMARCVQYQAPSDVKKSQTMCQQYLQLIMPKHVTYQQLMISSPLTAYASIYNIMTKL